MFHPLVVLNGTGTITYTALLTLLQWMHRKQDSYEGSEQAAPIVFLFSPPSLFTLNYGSVHMADYKVIDNVSNKYNFQT